MPQVLKDSLRNAIVEAAKRLFLEKGFNNATMRDIAAEADMTVGNLYRYFENKDDLKQYILKDTLNELQELFSKLSYNNIVMEARVFNIKANTDDLKKLMTSLTKRLLKIYFDNNVEFQIIMEDEEVNEQIIDWFTNSISSLISQHYFPSGYSQEKKILSRSYGISIFNGLKHIFSSSEGLPVARLFDLVYTFLSSYITMLDQDLRSK